jgi:3-oxoacyl-[acyl-carrier protein] reductase
MTDKLPNYPDLQGKVAVVTGGSGSIGAGTSRLLAQNGVKVGVNGRRADVIEKVVSEIKSRGGTALGVVGDCTDSGALERIRQQVEQELGPVDILAAFAGGTGDPTPSEQMSDEKWRSVLETNLTASFLTVKAFLPGMIERKRGSIILMASSAGRLPGEANIAYAAAKAGVLMLSRHLAKEMGKHGIRVNCLAPSSVMNEKMKQHMPPEQQKRLAESFPLGRLGQPEDVGLVTLFLASDSSSWLTGMTLDVSGGRIIV